MKILLLIVLFIGLLYSKQTPKRAQFPFDKNVSYIITDPTFLTWQKPRVDSTNPLYQSIQWKIKNELQKCLVTNFKELPDSLNRIVTISFNTVASKNDGMVDSLPYTIREYCLGNKISYFAAFYVYKTNNELEIEKDNYSRLRIPVVTQHAMYNVSVDINTAFDNIQIGLAIFDVKENRLLYIRRTDDDTYSSSDNLIDNLFDKLDLD